MVGEHSYHAQATVVRAGEGKKAWHSRERTKSKDNYQHTQKGGGVRLQISCFSFVSCDSLICTFFLFLVLRWDTLVECVF